MHISIFDMFSIGVGPSSSHTVGPMRAAKRFIDHLDGHTLKQVQRVHAELFGSLALTGIGHGSDKAVIMGLMGETPEHIDPDSIDSRMHALRKEQKLSLGQQHEIHFDYAQDLSLHMNKVLPKHTNGMCFTAFDSQNNAVLSETYYSVGGGFIVREDEFDQEPKHANSVPYPFDTAAELIAHCKQAQLSIAELMLENEKFWRSEQEVTQGLLHIADIMQACIEKGCRTHGHLPGFLQVKRRAPELFDKLKNREPVHQLPHEDVMNWLNLFAMAVNEENAAGGRIVTAPTNGAAGIVPAVLAYFKKFCQQPTQDKVLTYLLTAGAIAILYKKRASISGAEVGCQGEVGVASSMAAGALTAALGGTLAQIENAAEIAMEHHLGMTCDPVGGLVQIPCIERNAMGSVKAVNAARLALMESGENKKVPLDKVIATMWQTGRDMMTIYKETSQGGLAVNIIEC
jgi:L-serine dehydratase